MKKNWLILLLIILLFIFPLISANRISNEIVIKNYISNINEFPDYEFILSVQYEYLSSTSISFVNQSNGLIPVWEIGGSLDSASIYALKKSNIEYGWKKNGSVNYILDLEDIGAKRVISNLEFSEDTASLSVKNIIHYYDIDLNTTKNKPDKIEIQKDYSGVIMFFFLVGLPVWILIIIILIIVFISRKRKNKKKKK